MQSAARLADGRVVTRARVSPCPPLELSALYLFCVSILEAWRRQRPLSREPVLWAGVLLMLSPPVMELGMYLWRWQP
jgi:hypothetical protein